MHIYVYRILQIDVTSLWRTTNVHRAGVAFHNNRLKYTCSHGSRSGDEKQNSNTF